MAISLGAFFLLFLASFAKPDTILNNPVNARIIFVILLAIVSVNVVFRDVSTGDTQLYVDRLLDLQHLSYSEARFSYPGDPLFLLLQWIIAKITTTPYVFLAIAWTVFVLSLMNLLNQLFSNPWQKLVVFFSFSMFPFFYSLATNVIRQGLAVSLLLIVLSYYLTGEKNRRWKFFFLLAASCLFHWSAVPFALLLLVLHRFDFKLRTFIIVWLTSAIVFFTNAQQVLLRPLLPYIPKLEAYQSYSFQLTYSNGSNRLDFFLFSTLWIACAIIAARVFSDSMYTKLVKVYIGYNTVFLLMGFIPFSDRIALYSWFLIPLIVWIPILKAKNYSAFIVSSMLIVTLVVGIFSNSIMYHRLF